MCHHVLTLLPFLVLKCTPEILRCTPRKLQLAGPRTSPQLPSISARPISPAEFSACRPSRDKSVSRNLAMTKPHPCPAVSHLLCCFEVVGVKRAKLPEALFLSQPPFSTGDTLPISKEPASQGSELTVSSATCHCSQSEFFACLCPLLKTG